MPASPDDPPDEGAQKPAGLSRSPSSSSLLPASSPAQLSTHSSRSSVSRASSVRSTDSVQAVQVKSPPRGATPASSRANSSAYFTPYMLRHGANTVVREELHVPLPKPGITLQPPSLPPTPGGLAPSDQSLSHSPSSNSLIRKSPQDFDFGESLGDGSYSSVWAVTERQPPFREYALKILDKRHIIKEKKQKYVNIERDTLHRLDRHPGIVRLYWTFQNEQSLYFVLEIAKNGEILNFIKQYGSFDLVCARYYAAQLVSAIEHIHARGVIHRDLKPENILLDHNMRIKVTDFGTAKLLEAKSTEGFMEDRASSFVGTAEYVSPELLTNKTAYRSSDFWALGCIIYQFLAGKPPFKAASDWLIFQKIIKLDYTFPEGFPSDAQDLIQRLLVTDPALRLGAKGIDEIKAHPFFESVDFDSIWVAEPPVLCSGLVPPPPKREIITDSDFEYFAAEDEPDVGAFDDLHVDPDTEWKHPQVAFHHHAGVESVDSSTSSADKGLSKQNSFDHSLTLGDASTDPKLSKWPSHLLPSELLVLSSAVSDRSGLFSKKRLLILTDYPRLLLAREHKTHLKTKHEIFFGQPPSTSSIGPGSRTPPGHEVLLEVRPEGHKGLRLFTSLRSYRLEDPTGPPTRWMTALKRAQAAALAGDAR